MLNGIQGVRSKGFTLVELMVAVMIVATLIAVAAPNFREWLMNVRIHTVAESMQNGLQEARSEAIRRNTAVEFHALANAGTWEIVNMTDMAVLDQSKDSAQLKNINLIVLPAGATKVAFNFMGSPMAPADGSPPITSIMVDADPAILPAANSRELMVVVNPASGSSRMCDPNIPQPSSRAC
jgi:type IV fimbrial biogenesis protein FimT